MHSWDKDGSIFFAANIFNIGLATGQATVVSDPRQPPRRPHHERHPFRKKKWTQNWSHEMLRRNQPFFLPRFKAMSVTATANCAMGNGSHSSVQLDNRGRLWVCKSLPPVARCCCEMPSHRNEPPQQTLHHSVLPGSKQAKQRCIGDIGFPQLLLQPRQHQLLLHVLLQTYRLLYTF